MPKTLQVQQFAFEFDGSVRVFSAVTKMFIDSVPDREQWQYSSGRSGWNTRWHKLLFAAWVDDQRQLSGTDTKFHALSNAIEDSTTPVYFYPRYMDGAGTLHTTTDDRYEVGPNWDRIRIFDAPRVGISTAAKRLDLRQVGTIPAMPAWASR